MTRFSCPSCRARITWHVRGNKHKCSRCRKEWSKRSLPLRLTPYQWRDLLRWFIRKQSADAISIETGIRRERILRALRYTRMAMARDVPSVFSGIVEVDETYMGGKWFNKRKRTRDKGTKRGRGTTKQPVFGIYARNGTVWAELVDDVKAGTLLPLIERQVRKGSTVCSDTFRSYTGVATQGYVHRLVDHGKEYSDKKGTHINGLEGFWGYLKRQLAAKGGIRREWLHLYLAEYVWRYNHRKLSLNEQVKRLMKLVDKRRLVGG